MTQIDEGYAAARFRGLSSSQLRAILTKEKDDYEPEALALVRAELAHREAEGESESDADDATSERPMTRPVTRGSSWFDIVAAILVTASVAAPISVFVWGDAADQWLTLIYVPWAITAYGLVRRAAWAFYLGIAVFLSMLVVPPSPQSTVELVVRFAWVLGNVGYFIVNKQSYRPREPR